MGSEIKILKPSDLKREVAVVVGTRPGIVMFAPIIHALRRHQVPHFIIHSGQHYSPNMDAQFFKDLELPQPEYRIEGVNERRTHGGQTAAMLEGIESILLMRKPRLILVGGDANTNLAGALAARKLQIAVGHVEAGERSYDWQMPEEHNRRIIDHISDFLFVTGEKAIANLKKEGVQGEILLVGNPIVDASMQHKELANKKSNILRDMEVQPEKYAVLTSHREENVDYEDRLSNILTGISLAVQATGLHVLFFMHPRTKKRIKEFNMENWLRELEGIIVHEAVGYLDFISLICNSRMVYTDSGGVQQEACIHKIPCITLRDNTEWVETLEIGANILAGTEPEEIKQAAMESVKKWPGHWEVPFGDGNTGDKIAMTVKKIIG